MKEKKFTIEELLRGLESSREESRRNVKKLIDAEQKMLKTKQYTRAEVIEFFEKTWKQCDSGGTVSIPLGVHENMIKQHPLLCLELELKRKRQVISRKIKNGY